MFGTRYRIRTGVNAVKGHYPRPLDEPSKKGRATVAGPSVSLPREVSRRCGSQNLAVLGGNDPHSYGVTSHRASMNTLRPKNYYKVLSADLSIM